MTCSAPDRGSGGGGRPGINRLRSLLSDPLLRHSLLLMATAMLGNAANLVFQIVMNRRLTDVEYGILAAMVALMAILMLPLEALRTTLAHRTAMWMKEGRRAAIRPFYHLWLRRMLLAWAALLVVALLAGPAWGRVFRLGGAAPLWITGVGLSGILLLPVISGVLQGMQRFAAFAWALQIPNIVRFLLGVGLVLWIPRAWAGYSAQAVGFIAAAVCAGYWVRAGWRGWNEPDAPVRASEAYFFKSLIVLGAFAVLMLADVLLVKAWFDEDMAGRYSRAATIARAIVYLPMPVAMALFPKVVSRGERTGEDRRMLVRALAGVGALLAASATAAWVFAPLLWRLFTGMEAAAADRTLLRGLVLALAPLAPAHLLLNFELAQHRFRICAVAVAGTVVYLVGVFLRHPTPLAVAGWLGGSSLAVVLTLAVALWNDQTRPAALAPEPDA